MPENIEYGAFRNDVKKNPGGIGVNTPIAGARRMSLK
jgi:hypothetical protein